MHHYKNIIADHQHLQLDLSYCSIVSVLIATQNLTGRVHTTRPRYVPLLSFFKSVCLYFIQS